MGAASLEVKKLRLESQKKTTWQLNFWHSVANLAPTQPVAATEMALGDTTGQRTPAHPNLISIS